MRLKLLAFIFLLLGIVPNLIASEKLALSDPYTRVSLDSYVSFINVSNPSADKLNYQQLNSLKWQQDDGAFNVGYSKDVWWLKVDVSTQVTNTSVYLLEVSYPVLDFLDVYLVDHQKKSIELIKQLGDKLPYFERQVNTTNFLLPLHFDVGKDYSILLKVHGSSSLQVPMTLWHPISYHEHNQSLSIANGVIWGALLVMVFYNLVIFFRTRDKSYLYYVLYVFSMVMFLFSLKGYSFQYLWPEQTYWNDRIIVLFLSGIVLFAGLFTESFLQIKERMPKFYYVVVAIYIGSFISMLIAPFVEFRTSVIYAISLSIFGCSCGLFIGTYLWRQGVKAAKYYTISWWAMLCGGIVLALNKWQIIPVNMLTENFILIGSVFEAFLLSFALSEKYNEEKQLRLEAEHAYAVAQENINAQLNVKVKERTAQLEEALQKLKLISETDALTGLNNRRCIDDLIQQRFEYCIENQTYIAIVMLDIDFFKSFNDKYGHQTGDDCLIHVAGLLKKVAAENECVCGRLGGEEFSLIIEDSDKHTCRDIAQQVVDIIEQSKFMFEDKILKVTISAGISLIVPRDKAQIPELFSQADQALYKAKNNGRNRVEMYKQEYQVPPSQQNSDDLPLGDVNSNLANP
ncbi:sensor domain-containing diguanylate cyclase [Psychrobium sp. MM17-31]|uniref:sensor domain-containing diguanylate cyclase n=1 Tax=Psychrobium sp. MM17-31 TaxID=2917758 RepID=UPI001EF59C36|nr:diguanylate cyclase [Psychrobium sp. MM17-31]MCG7530651.1 sensor domain-containing diguanylate cyclase [Psychrobium sp. MM17-31]